MKGRWKDQGNYDPALSPQGWAWEFLRRNPAYREDWKKYEALCRRYGSWEDAERFAPAQDAFECDPPARRGETFEQWEARVDQSTARYAALRSAIAQRWDLLLLPYDPHEPGSGKTCHRFRLPALILRHVAGWRRPDCRLPLTKSEAAIVFDMGHPLKPQMERVSRFLRETQKWLRADKKMQLRIDAPKYPPRKLIEYLRILDARSEGASATTIISTLYPRMENDYPNFAGRKALAMAEAVALRLREGEYRKLVELKLKRREKISAR